MVGLMLPRSILVFAAPLEMISTVIMCGRGGSDGLVTSLNKVWRQEGLRGLFKGNGANILKVAPSRGLQFLVYESIKRSMVDAGLSLTPGYRLIAAGLAGMSAATVVYPLDVAKTLLTLYPDRCTGVGQALGYAAKSGVGGLYRGLGPTLVAMFPYVGVEFMVYETLKVRPRRAPHPHPHPHTHSPSPAPSPSPSPSTSPSSSLSPLTSHLSPLTSHPSPLTLHPSPSPSRYGGKPSSAVQQARCRSWRWALSVAQPRRQWPTHSTWSAAGCRCWA